MNNKDKTVRCDLCEHRCLLKNGQIGICGVRQNIDGKIKLLTDSRVTFSIDPIEKKPFYHFMPHSLVFSIGTYGCNFGCLFCQNFYLSQEPKNIIKQTKDFKKASLLIKDLVNSTHSKLTPEKIVDFCVKNNIKIIAYTYNEPTIFFDYNIKVMKLAKQAGLKNVYVSNGYMTLETIEKLKPYLDAINIDLKAFTNEFYSKVCFSKLDPVLRNIKQFVKKGIWVELTTLLIPDYNDSEKELNDMASFIASISSEIPWHISRFFPTYKMMDVPVTPIESLEKAAKIGKKHGLKYVYIGNIQGPLSLKYNATYCPKCKKPIIIRKGYEVYSKMDKNKCPICGTKIAGVF